MEVKTPDWIKDAIFYQIFPDRFAKSDRVSKQGLQLEKWDSPPTVYGFKGGDLLGVSEHLDYLQELGINSLYLNPITASASNHRYHTYDYFHIDPLLGGDMAFRELLDAAHARNIRIVPDGVFNHASRGMWQFHHVLENGAGSPYVDWFHFNPEFLNGGKKWGAYPSPDQQNMLNNGIPSYEALGYQAWWNLPALPKLNTQTAAVREYLLDSAVHWVNFGADGWRLDVPAEINDDSFWREFRRRVKTTNPEAYIVGEIWHESQRWLQGDQFDAVMNYLLTGALMGWLIGERLPPYIFRIGDYHKYLKPINAEAFADRIDYLLNLYHPEINYAQLNLLDSHDTPRFITTASNDFSALKLAWLFIFTYIGAPCIYYGDEIGLSGGPDPECRASFEWNKEKWNKELYDYAHALILLRKTHPALRRGSYTRLLSTDNVFAFTRSVPEETAIIIFNSGNTSTLVNIPTPSLGVQSLYIPIFGDNKNNTYLGNNLELHLSPRSGIVLSTVSN
jgi:cyclomaltodextrinase / maltogenic alpha-amylase / neopullulanase